MRCLLLPPVPPQPTQVCLAEQQHYPRDTSSGTPRHRARGTTQVCLAEQQHYPTPFHVIRLWLHEGERVFGDRLINAADREKFAEIVAEVGVV